MMYDSDLAVRAERLSKRYGDHQALADASFTVPWGAVTGFVGANGSGKTTTLRALLRLITPDSGTAIVAGRGYDDHPDPRRVVGAVLDRLGAHPGVTGRRYLRLVAASAGVDPDRVDTVLAQVGLAEVGGRRTGSYSTGMRQRLALGTALLTDPPVLLLDEPASGLDPAGIRWLRSLLQARARAGGAVFVSTHQLAELEAVVDHVVVLDRGRVLASERTEELLQRTGQARLEDAVLSLTAATHP